MKNTFLLLSLLLSTFAFGQTQLWSTHIDTAVTFSSPKAVKITPDATMDIVMGGGRDGIPDARGVVAIDGDDGSILWEFAAEDEIFDTPVFQDISGDGLNDVFIGGRYGEFYAINGQTGNMIWEFFPYSSTVAADSGVLNFYTPQLIPDQNGDNIKDILVANGGDHAAPPWDTLRPVGSLMVIDAMTGQVLARDTMPDGEETYCSPLCIDMENNGVYHVIFGSGGEDDGGSLWRVPLTDLMANDISGATMLAIDPDRGFIAPASVADMNFDGVYDIVSQGYNGTVYAFDGAQDTLLWSVTMPNSESSAEPIFGNFTGDQTPDVFAVIAKGSAPSFFDYYQVMIDGATGQIAFLDSISDLHFASANAIDLDLNGRDEVIASLNYHTGTHFEHQLKVFDFHNNTISDLYVTEPGVNLGCTPLVQDIDGNGLVDFVYAYRADSVNPMGANGFKVARLEGTYTNPGPGIAWGGYMGNGTDGIYNFETYNCGTLNINLAYANITCNGFDDAYATIDPVGGTAPYTMLWSNGDITDSIGGLSPDNYQVFVVDSTGCIKTANFNIFDPYVLTWGAVTTPICPGDSNANATLASSGCPCMFSGCLYDWESIDSLKTATHLWAGWQSVTITHLDGCVVTDSIYINEAYPILDSLDIQHVECATDPMGSIYMHLHDSIATTVGWSNGSHDAMIDSLDAGFYHFDLTDTRGCFFTDTVEVTAADTLLPNYTLVEPICYGDSNGTITGGAIGGMGYYTYSWSNGDSIQTADSLATGYYTLTVVDSVGCTAVLDSIMLNEPDALALTVSGVDCITDTCTGSAEANITGGVGGYTYLWNDPNATTTYNADPLCVGTYTVIVTDSNGCSITDSVSVGSQVSVMETSDVQITLYPNPATVQIQIQGLEKGESVELYDIKGALVDQKTANSNGLTMDVSRLTSGKYVVRIIQKDQVLQTPLIIQ